MKMNLRSAVANSASVLAIAAISCAIPTQVFAQDGADGNDDRIIVTGSRLQGSSENAPSPVDVFDSSDVAVSGGASIQDFLFDLPLNVGTESQPNIFNQNFSAGTENINFRGLGLSSD